MKKLILALFVSLLVFGCAPTDQYPDLEKSQLEQLTGYILENHQAPAEYVVGSFSECDVVILGEYHGLKHDLKLIHELVPMLYENGIRTIATEFANRADQPLIDSLISAESYDPALARFISVSHYSLAPYQEYLDLYEVVWAFNQSLPEGARPFRILAMNCLLDWSYIQSEEDFQNPKLRQKVWAGCGEEDWAEVVLAEVAASEKVLIHCGIHHAFTRYLQPIAEGNGEFIRFETDRMGRYIYNALGDRCKTIFLHSLWTSREDRSTRRPANGAIDQVMAALGDQFRPVGFDVTNSPFGDLTDPGTYYSIGYENFTLSDFCDGYIYTMPLAEYECVAFAEGFYTEEHLDLARVRAPAARWRQATVEDFVANGKKRLVERQERHR